MAIVLIIRDNGNTSRVKLSSKPLVAGRSSKCSIKITDSVCSGQHCAFLITKENRVLIKDLESTNGTFLNDCKILDSHLMLEDVVKIGECEITIDPSELSVREKRVLTRDEPTSQIKFVNLKKDKGIKPSEALKAKKEQIAKAENKRVEVKKSSSSDKDNRTSEERLRDRIKARAKNLGQNTSSNITNVESERVIDLEESSGSTKLIKIDRPKKKNSIASKIKKVFKK